MFAFDLFLSFWLLHLFFLPQKRQHPSVLRTSVTSWWSSLLFFLVSSRSLPCSLLVVIKYSRWTAWQSDTPYGMLSVKQSSLPPEMLLIKYWGGSKECIRFLSLCNTCSFKMLKALQIFCFEMCKLENSVHGFSLHFWLLSHVKCAQQIKEISGTK